LSGYVLQFLSSADDPCGDGYGPKGKQLLDSEPWRWR